MTAICNKKLCLTLCNVDIEGALGDLLACKQHVDAVRPLHYGAIGATEYAVALIFQNQLHCVFFALGINDDHTDVASTSALSVQETCRISIM